MPQIVWGIIWEVYGAKAATAGKLWDDVVGVGECGSIGVRVDGAGFQN